MAHKKGVGSTTNGRDSNPKYLGVKRYDLEYVKAGHVLVRQRRRDALNVRPFLDNQIVVYFARRSNQRGPVAGTYTNEDIERLNQENGIARYDGKTERLE